MIQICLRSSAPLYDDEDREIAKQTVQEYHLGNEHEPATPNIRRCDDDRFLLFKELERRENYGQKIPTEPTIYLHSI